MITQYSKQQAEIYLAEIRLLTNRLEHEAHRSAILQDALVCILECTDDSPHTIAEETLEAIAHLKGDTTDV